MPAAVEHQRCRSWCRPARQVRTSPSRSGGNPGQGEQGLEIDGSPVAIGAAQLLHGPGRRGRAGGQRVAGEREIERRSHSLGHPAIVEEEEGVAGVEQDRAEGAQRNLSRAPSPSIASRASGS